MVRLTCKYPTIQNVSLIVVKHNLLDFIWYRAITQCTHTVHVLTSDDKATERSPEGYSYADERGIPIIVAKRLDGLRCQLVKKQASVQATVCQMGTKLPTKPPSKRDTAPNFRPMSVVARCHLVRRWASAQATLCQMGTQLQKGAQPNNFRPMSIVAKWSGRPSGYC